VTHLNHPMRGFIIPSVPPSVGNIAPLRFPPNSTILGTNLQEWTNNPPPPFGSFHLFVLRGSISTHTHTHTHTHSHIHTHIFTHTHIHTHIFTHRYSHTHIHTHTYSHTHIHTHIFTHTYSHTHIHTHIFTHDLRSDGVFNA